MGTSARETALWLLAIGWLAAGVAATGLCAEQPPANPVEQSVTQGSLRIVQKDGGIVACPLKHTDVRADVSGFIARVKVTQTFENPLDEKIEAVYVFPLPHKSAVDDMTLVIGQRRIVGLIKRRATAREIYQQALERGLTAALLEQERPNIFTQSVGNIPPRQEVKVEISYVDVLEYDMGVYELHFPMVVGPRYIPGKPTSKTPPVPPELKGKVGELPKGHEGKDKPKGTGWSPDTDRVKDASRITPPVLKPGFRNGHDISLAVRLDAGVPIQGLKVTNHKAEVERIGKSGAAVALSSDDRIPNKDFVLRYAVVGEKPEMALLSHLGEPGWGYFLLMIQPKEDERLTKSPPREICFLIDVSGSMRGGPTAKVRQAMAELLKLCKPADTLQVITFASRARKVFPKAVPANQQNIDTALNFTRGIRGGGGTEMLKGVKMAINDPLDPKRLRIVLMLTDGYIGNEAEIIAEVGRRCGDHIRFWCIGIGSSPNRFLVDGVGRQGGGMAKILGLNDDPKPLAIETMQRIHRAQLAGIRIDWGGMEVFETYPARIPELWAGRPVILFGRYAGGGTTQVVVRGKVEGEPAQWPLAVRFPAAEPKNGVLAKAWARRKIEDLMQQTYYQGSPSVEEEATDIALEYRLMSQYTSFVAVDEAQAGKLTEPARPPRRMLVPAPIPAGTRYEGFFGDGRVDPTDRPVLRMYDISGLVHGRPVPSIEPPSRTPVFRGTPPRRNGRRLTRGIYSGRDPGRWSRGWGQVSTGAGALKRGRIRYGAGTLRAPGPRQPVTIGGGVELEYLRVARGDQASWSYSWQATRAQGKRMRQMAQDALKRAEELRKGGRLDAARARYTLAYLLDEACRSYGSGSDVGAKALEAIEAIDKELRKSWAKQIPALEKRLEVVLRDVSVPDALAAVSRAAKIPVKLLPGSVDDARALLRRKGLRVTYLDLRRATVAQALDWLLVPNRMTWWVAKGSVVAGTCRRMGIDSPWVYGVSHLALLSPRELGKIKAHKERLAAAKKAADDFLVAAKAQLKLADDAAVWFAPGELLVFADAATHEAAARLFAELADPKGVLPRHLFELHKATLARAAEAREPRAKWLEAVERARVAASLRVHSWALLAAAAAGKLDLEALTELQVAWKSPAVVKLPRSVSLRSLWAVAESAGALPKEAELAALAQRAQAAARQAAGYPAGAFAKSPDDASALLRALYAALARPEDAALTAQVREALAKGKTPRLAAARTVALALLAPAGEIERKALVQLVTKGSAALTGEDLVALAALACRRAGGDAWTAFRAEARHILGRQPLPGSVVVLVNRLARPTLPLLARAAK